MECVHPSLDVKSTHTYSHARNIMKCAHSFFVKQSSDATQVHAKVNQNLMPTTHHPTPPPPPPPLFMHYPRCIIYTCPYKTSKVLKNMWVLFPHSIHALPSCILRTILGPLDLYYPHGSIPDFFYFLVQYANRWHLKISFWLHLDY
jgi:hypothetical protein